MASNPLAARSPVAAQKHPAEMHARIWGHVQQMGPDEQAQQLQQSSYSTPILGALSGNPDVTRKDVIKAAADAAGSGRIPAEAAVSLISRMPMEQDKLQPWLKGLYAANLSALVHLKAAAMPAPQQAAPPVQPQMPSPLAGGA